MPGYDTSMADGPIGRVAPLRPPEFATAGYNIFVQMYYVAL